MELRLLGTDEFKDEFVIFYIDNGEDLNAYIWVSDGGKVRITDIYGLASYCTHSGSPIYVGNDVPEEMEEKARESLSGLSSEKKKQLVDSFNERIEQLKKDDELYREREEYEDACIEDIESGQGIQDGKFWFE